MKERHVLPYTLTGGFLGANAAGLIGSYLMKSKKLEPVIYPPIKYIVIPSILGGAAGAALARLVRKKQLKLTGGDPNKVGKTALEASLLTYPLSLYLLLKGKPSLEKALISAILPATVGITAGAIKQKLYENGKE